MNTDAERRAQIRASQIAKGLRPASDDHARTELPDAERGRGPEDIKMLDRLNRRLTLNAYVQTKTMSPEEQRNADLRAREHLEHTARLVAEDARDRVARAEAQALAEIRGEEVEVEPSGLRRVLDRDPLLSLARAGHLTPEQLETGQTVRDLYDSRAADAGAMEYTGMPSGAHDHEAFVAKRFTRAKCSEMIGRIERRIALDCRDEPACLTMLRAVCERGLSASSQGSGRGYVRNRTALARALDVADLVLRRQA
jgi:hypothetical protein